MRLLETATSPEALASLLAKHGARAETAAEGSGSTRRASRSAGAGVDEGELTRDAGTPSVGPAQAALARQRAAPGRADLCLRATP
jgi:hypothetical protein